MSSEVLTRVEEPEIRVPKNETVDSWLAELLNKRHVTAHVSLKALGIDHANHAAIHELALFFNTRVRQLRSKGQKYDTLRTWSTKELWAIYVRDSQKTVEQIRRVVADVLQNMEKAY